MASYGAMSGGQGAETTVATEPEGAWPLADRYAIERPLAVGGMSTLYVARALATGERVALKVLDPRIAQDAAGVQRFLREVRLTSSIGHPGIVQVRDAGVARGTDGVEVPFLAMELLDGQNLADLIAAGDRTQLEAAGWFRALLSALAALHTRGVVHRDLKYENVFGARSAGGQITIKLIDLGIARELFDVRAPTTTGTALGTVYYMAPEQSLDARSVTASADVYALGVMLYQLFAGVFPFDGESPHAVLVRSHTTPHEPLGARVPGLDRRLAALVDRCLSKDPFARPVDAAALADELLPLLDDARIAAWLGARLVDPTTFRDGLLPAASDAPANLADAVSLSLVPPLPGALPVARSAPVAPGPSRRVAWAVALLVVLLAVAVAAFRGREPAPTPVVVAPVAPVVVAPVAPVVVAPVAPPVPTAVVAPPPVAPLVPAVEPAGRARVLRRGTPSLDLSPLPSPPLAVAPLAVPVVPPPIEPAVVAAPPPPPVLTPPPTVTPPPPAAVTPRPVAPRAEPEAPFTF